MSSSIKLVTMNQWLPVDMVPFVAFAEKLYPDNVHRELLVDDCETKLLLDYEEDHDDEPSAEE
jgi:hypothetical protein